MSKKGKWLLTGVLVATLSLSNLSFACTEKSTQEVSMEVKVMAVKGVAVSEKILEELKEITEEVVQTYLAADYSKSWKVIAETKVLSKAENVHHCESIVSFLYKETFTAVLIRIEFDFIPAQIKEVKIQRNYIPELEKNL